MPLSVFGTFSCQHIRSHGVIGLLKKKKNTNGDNLMITLNGYVERIHWTRFYVYELFLQSKWLKRTNLTFESGSLFHDNTEHFSLPSLLMKNQTKITFYSRSVCLPQKPFSVYITQKKKRTKEKQKLLLHDSISPIVIKFMRTLHALFCEHFFVLCFVCCEVKWQQNDLIEFVSVTRFEAATETVNKENFVVTKNSPHETWYRVSYKLSPGECKMLFKFYLPFISVTLADETVATGSRMLHFPHHSIAPLRVRIRQSRFFIYLNSHFQYLKVN